MSINDITDDMVIVAIALATLFVFGLTDFASLAIGFFLIVWAIYIQLTELNKNTARQERSDHYYDSLY